MWDGEEEESYVGWGGGGMLCGMGRRRNVMWDGEEEDGHVRSCEGNADKRLHQINTFRVIYSGDLGGQSVCFGI